MKCVLALVFLILLVACSSKKSDINAYLNEVNKEIKVSKKLVVVIPQSGCSSCVRKAIDFLENTTIEKKNIQIIFTEFEDRKFLEIIYKGLCEKYDDIIFDKENLWRDYGLFSNYPLAIKIDVQIDFFEYIDPYKQIIWKQLELI